MNRALLMLGLIALTFSASSTAATQSPEEERRAAITLLRAINTAEAATMRSGHYVALAELVGHPSMARVKPDINVSDAAVTFHGAQVRLALSADAKQYVVTVVNGAPNYTAAFSDEGGIIYTGKALE
jgi:hypothetical protein